MPKYRTFHKGFLQGHSTLRVTSDFGLRNFDGEIQKHYGIDIGVPAGTTLLAPLSGKIITRRLQKNGAGLYVTIQHVVEPGVYLYILLAHLKEVESYINVGYDIKEGEKIGLTGGATDDPNAGRSTGAHLHLEVRKGSNVSANAVDPKYNFLANETLIAAKNGKNLSSGGLSIPDPSSFDGIELKSMSHYKYSTTADITMSGETERQKTPKKKKLTTEAKERLAPGIWQITKLIIDSSVENKQILDSSISTQQGSLLNFFRKVCQEPLVEFSGDTFGNQYYWIVKKPPFDKESVERMIDLTMFDLSDETILRTDLSWNTDNIYSWYQYIPYADLLGVKEATLFTPAVFFPEFAAVWGSRPLSLQSNYYNFAFSGRFNQDKDENKRNADNIIRNAVRDFKYMIESNAHTAFTRKGTIVLNGDRRIKRGTLVLHTTGELFYVDSVVNNYSVATDGCVRTTTLNVSRGMFPNYIYGKEINGVKMSYFDIIDWGEDFDINNVTSDNWKDFISKWKVDFNNFSFFLSKQQLFWENIDNKTELDAVIVNG